MSDLTYQVVGADGKIYGPANPEFLRQWLAEGRLTLNSPVLPAGAAAWTTLGKIPEFAPAPTPPGAAGIPPTPVIAPGPTRRKHPLATTGLVCGIVSMCLCCGCCFPVDILGIVLSLVALVEINHHPDRFAGRTEAIIGLVLSGAAFLLYLAWSLANHAQMNFHAGDFS